MDEKTLKLEEIFCSSGLKQLAIDAAKTQDRDTIAFIERKIHSSLELYILWSGETDMPFIDVVDDQHHWVMYVFSDYNLASGLCQRMEQSGRVVRIEEITSGKRRMEVFSYFSDCGANNLLLDSILYLPLSDFIKVSDRDGFSKTTPLRNSQLNAIMNYYIQELFSDHLTEGVQSLFFGQLMKSYFLVPTSVDLSLLREDDTTNVDFPVFRDDDNRPFMPVASDPHQFENSVNMTAYAGVVFDFFGLFNLLETYKYEYFVLNYGTSHIIMNKKFFTEVRMKASEPAQPN